MRAAMSQSTPFDEKEPPELRKGAWTAEEDKKLAEFIEKNKGHGSWRTLPQRAGLQRCGKSCRLRWTNYLRPNIKRGNFSVDEENTIARLHGLLGNKWATIASHLPGRTDNEVKNHWNTHLRKRLARIAISNVIQNRSHQLYRHSPATSSFSLIQSRYQNLLCSAIAPASLSNSYAPRIADDILGQIIQQDSDRNVPANDSTQPRSSCASFPDNSFVTHMAQWELARLEAEARLANPSKKLALSLPPLLSHKQTTFRAGYTRDSKFMAPHSSSALRFACCTITDSISSADTRCVMSPSGSPKIVDQPFSQPLVVQEYGYTSADPQQDDSISSHVFNTCSSSDKKENIISNIQIVSTSYRIGEEDLHGVGTNTDSGEASHPGSEVYDRPIKRRFLERDICSPPIETHYFPPVLPNEVLNEMSPLASASNCHQYGEKTLPMFNLDDLRVPPSPNLSSESASSFWCNLVHEYSTGALPSSTL
ncbi:hypothetical protein KP509_13G061300 [Ceratopteris richardii]|uniref:Uncharacterized protein n=1 Tax=Ceratopteris richardii TaxID=49495 RepID=A0A8T2TID1_CERRI|nr:hypothetical protein KP509_13G061300 [Ceratopteris richardii]